MYILYIPSRHNVLLSVANQRLPLTPVRGFLLSTFFFLYTFLYIPYTVRFLASLCLVTFFSFLHTILHKHIHFLFLIFSMYLTSFIARECLYADLYCIPLLYVCYISILFFFSDIMTSKIATTFFLIE
jgi:hypothetical protein